MITFHWKHTFFLCIQACLSVRWCHVWNIYESSHVKVSKVIHSLSYLKHKNRKKCAASFVTYIMQIERTHKMLFTNDAAILSKIWVSYKITFISLYTSWFLKKIYVKSTKEGTHHNSSCLMLNTGNIPILKLWTRQKSSLFPLLLDQFWVVLMQIQMKNKEIKA